ncbi:MAG: BACON domain-containing protein, partial [Prolixibacteraceae bacterium]|nr:BACON domain-containing protein [Prolixibacteraceae bacterium]
MKKFTLFLCMFFGLIISVLGSENQVQTQMLKVEESSMSISSNEVTIGAASGSTVSVEIISTELVYVICENDWLAAHIIANEEINADNSVLLITASRNPFDESRSSSIRVYTDAGDEQFISVLQNANTLNLLELSENSLFFNANDDSVFQIDVNSNTNWNVVSNQSWVNVSQNTGNGNQCIGISVATNPSGTKRVALVSVTANGATSKTIAITQWGQSQSVLDVSVNEVTLNYYWDDSIKINVSSNVAWTAVSNQNWIQVSPSSGLGSGAIYIKSVSGEPEASRQGTVTLSATGVETQTIQVNQVAASEFYITLPQTEFTVNSLGFGLIEIPVSSNTFWTVGSNDGVVDFKPETGFANETLYIATEPAFYEDDHEAVVWIEQRDYEGDIDAIELFITIKGQTQAVLEPDALNTSIAAEGNSEAYIAIYSNLNWTATSNQSWLSVNTPQYTGYGFLGLTASANVSSTTRYGTITLSSAGYGSKTILVTQPGNGIELPKLETLTPNLELNAVNGSARTIEILSNLIWTASSDQSWLTLNKTMGSNDGEIIISATENNLATTRQAIVTISAPGVNPVTVTVIQAAA